MIYDEKKMHVIWSLIFLKKYKCLLMHVMSVTKMHVASNECMEWIKEKERKKCIF